jgi:methylenetetrahydrofolate--tRNA-(uracil-5-)-methyltransferase
MGAESVDQSRLVVIGGGLAGCEAAWQAAERGVPVTLYDMKPERLSPAHVSEDLAELVCSNSFRASGTQNAVGLLKQEMRSLDSLIMRVADACAVPAGRALAVDRTAFSAGVTQSVSSHPLIEVRRKLVERLPDDPFVVLATGPLTSPEIARDLQSLLGEEYLYFYDAIAPTLYADSIDHTVVFRASRYEEGEGDYLNVPLNKDEYHDFVSEIIGAEQIALHRFEADLYFEGCLPIEEMARRGPQTLSFGPMKPVGLIDPRTGRRPFAVVQLRQEDREGTLFNLVGFQTKLKMGEQKRIFRSLPGLEKAVFARFGSVHRNTYVNAPKRLAPSLELHARPGLYLAGQMAGVEGYVESAALGGVAGRNAAWAILGQPHLDVPRETAHGALMTHLREAPPAHFQPMNVNFGLFPRLEEKAPGPRKKRTKREKNELLASRALAAMEAYRALEGAQNR